MNFADGELQNEEDAVGVASEGVSKPKVRLFKDLLLQDIFRWTCLMANKLARENMLKFVTRMSWSKLHVLRAVKIAGLSSGLLDQGAVYTFTEICNV